MRSTTSLKQRGEGTVGRIRSSVVWRPKLCMTKAPPAAVERQEPLVKNDSGQDSGWEMTRSSDIAPAPQLQSCSPWVGPIGAGWIRAGWIRWDQPELTAETAVTSLAPSLSEASECRIRVVTG